jgi:hypothetical protein
MERGDDFELASNVTEAGNFDDSSIKRKVGDTSCT